MRASFALLIPLAACVGACTHAERAGAPAAAPVAAPYGEVIETIHRDGDDLLSAGLGLAGLALPLPAPANPEAPTPAELRRRAIYSNWRGIVDLVPGSGFGQFYGSLLPIPGREFRAFAQLPGTNTRHRVLLQVPDGFDRDKRCLVVAPASGSRGVYGAIGVAAPWAFLNGCAVVYTDKGAGTGLYDAGSATGVALDGTRAPVGSAPLEFEPRDAAGTGQVLFRHAQSGENPEADWGRYAVQAMEFGLWALTRAWPDDESFRTDNSRVIGIAISNGAGALLRAAELPQAAGFRAIVAAEPNVHAPGGRAPYDYMTEAALYVPCAFGAAALADAPSLVPPVARAAVSAARCASLASAGLLQADDPKDLPAAAHAYLRERGWTDPALGSASVMVTFDLWRAIGVAYAAAHMRTGAGPLPCDYAYAPLDAAGKVRATTASERALWWSDGTGIGPNVGIGLVDGRATPGADPAFAGLRCLRDLWTGEGADAQRLRQGVADIQAQPSTVHAPIVVVLSGRDDGLVPGRFNNDDWVARARAANPGRAIAHYEVENVQHFDAFLGVPVLGARYLPMLPFVWRAADAAWAASESGRPLPASGTLKTRPRGMAANGNANPLTAEHLGDGLR